jgi:hypothetical protein
MGRVNRNQASGYLIGDVQAALAQRGFARAENNGGI